MNRSTIPAQPLPPRAAPALAWTHLRLRHRRMLIWLMATASAWMLFANWPGIDLSISTELMNAGGPGQPRFAYGLSPAVQLVYEVVPWLGRGALLACLILLMLPRPGRNGSAALGRWSRRAPAMLLVLVLGLWLVVNAGFKEHWGRPRPQHVEALGGHQPFRSIAEPSSLCDSNCSFPSGHAATGFVVMAAGLRAGASRRRHWAWAGLALGTLFGLGRMLQGGHFASDVIFAGLMIWGVTLAAQQTMLRWRAAGRRHNSSWRR